jgi:hypothetical protein
MRRRQRRRHSPEHSGRGAAHMWRPIVRNERISEREQRREAFIRQLFHLERRQGHDLSARRGRVAGAHRRLHGGQHAIGHRHGHGHGAVGNRYGSAHVGSRRLGCERANAQVSPTVLVLDERLRASQETVEIWPAGGRSRYGSRRGQYEGVV